MPITTLRASSYKLAWGASVYAKVSAINLYGVSVDSAVGNGAQILTIPDYPVSLAEVAAARSVSTLGISWSAGTNNGGSPVIDYRIIYSNGVTTVSIANVLASPYTALALSTGNNYMFTVEARNAFGYSLVSNSLYLYCAYVPSIVAVGATSISGSNFIVTWTAPSNNGAVITSYKIEI